MKFGEPPWRWHGAYVCGRLIASPTTLGIIGRSFVAVWIVRDVFRCRGGYYPPAVGTVKCARPRATVAFCVANVLSSLPRGDVEVVAVETVRGVRMRDAEDVIPYNG